MFRSSVLSSCVWCNVFVLASMCFSTGNASADNTGIINYNHNDELNIKLTLSLNKVPSIVNHIIIKLKNDSMKYQQIDRRYYDTVDINVEKFLTLYHDNANIYIELYSVYKHEKVCEVRLPIRLKYNDRYEREEDKHQCVRREGCPYYMELNCDDRKQLGSTDQTTMQAPMGHNNEEVYILEDKRMPERILTLEEGTSTNFTCLTRTSKYYYLRWYHMDENSKQIAFVNGYNGVSLAIRFIVNKFDNNTQLTCTAYSYSQTRNIIILGQSRIKILVKPTNAMPVYDHSMLQTEVPNITYYQNNQILKYICNGGQYIQCRWLELRGDNDVKLVVNQNKLNESTMIILMTEQHNDTKWFCMAYQNVSLTTKLQIIERKISNIIHFVMEKKTKPLDAVGVSDEAVEEDSSNGLQIPLLAGGLACGGALLVIALTTFVCCRSRRGARTSPHEVETYSSPRVQYIDLQISNPTCGRQVHHNETPYAQIIGFLEPNNK